MHTVRALLLMGIVAMPAARSRADAALDAYEKKVLQTEKLQLPYRLLRPAKIESGTKYPLVLLLHGAGERGNDNERQLVHGAKEFARKDRARKYPCFIVVPQCPKETWWSAKTRADLSRFADQPCDAMHAVLKLLDRRQSEFPIDRARVYVTGLSMGGFATWDLVARHPERFAAAAPICGGGDPAIGKRLAATPVWAFHGADDKVVPASMSRAIIAEIEKSGGKPHYTEYPKVGHDSWSRTYSDPAFFAWLFAQKRK